MKKVFLLLLLINIASQVTGEETVQEVKFFQSTSENDYRHDYFVSQLALAMEKTLATHGPYALKPVGFNTSQKRLIKELTSKGNIDVFWTMTTREREASLYSVNVPLLKNMAGCRLLLVRKGNESVFAKTSKLYELREFKVAQGLYWPDVDILRANGLPVIESPIYRSLFRLLIADRVDYLSRGCHEIWEEEEAYKNQLLVEPSLLILYDARVIFFTSMANRALGERINIGLQRAIKDGSFDKNFRNYSRRVGLYQRIDIDNRRIIKLSNPLIDDDDVEKLEERLIKLMHQGRKESPSNEPQHHNASLPEKFSQ